ncbi:hypothetical protein CTAYLR_007549 [Chrysophaeum taylorii]|uniref:Rho-GAP domain-containing protein n=1 Tax=Chrysophaeum taylorii TaxID=2483200 RepID=A0AAD7U4S4_9STRA|nr:hypothetical protein CTAYLR_007549 [Chrysophaeum taylorii]
MDEDGRGLSSSSSSSSSFAESEALIRGRWIAAELDARVRSFGDVVPVRVACLTWNVNGKNVPAQEVELGEWVGGGFEIYAIGVQEMVDLTAVNVVADGKTAKKRAELWKEMLDEVLGEQYSLVAQRHMVGVLLCVYAVAWSPAAKFGAAQCVEVSTASATCGVMGVLGNKGGVSIRLRALDTTLCFVCAHLAAHRENVEGRNSDVAAILAKTEFRREDGLLFGRATDAALMRDRTYLVYGEKDAEAEAEEREALRIEDHDVVFWLGDLNYRVHSNVETAECFARAELNDWHFLRANDQLNVERAAGRVFRGFREASLDFPVTYKYQVGTSILDRRPEKKVRAPAWCDRVLWRCRDSRRARSIEYSSAHRVVASDHKPVRGVFETWLVRIDAAKRRAAKVDVVRRLFGSGGAGGLEVSGPNGREENDDVVRVNLGRVRYGVPTTRRLRALNPSSSKVAHWRFVPPDDNGSLDASPSRKPWLRVEPRYGTLFPGEACVISITATIEARAARDLNSRADVLSDALSLRASDGGETFVCVAGDWLPSSWGMSLDELCVRKAAQPAPGMTTTLPVPKELWRLVDALHRNKRAPHLFFAPGNAAQLSAIRLALDADAPLPEDLSPYSLADALASFLAALATPLVPRHLLPTTDLVDASDLREWARDFLRRLAPAAYNTFVYCLAFFRDLLLSTTTNLLTPSKLAAVACNCMLPQDDAFLFSSEAPADPALFRGSLVASGTAFEPLLFHHRSVARRGLVVVEDPDLRTDPAASPCGGEASSSGASSSGAATTPITPISGEPTAAAAGLNFAQQRRYMSTALQYLLTTPAL